MITGIKQIQAIPLWSRVKLSDHKAQLWTFTNQVEKAYDKQYLQAKHVLRPQPWLPELVSVCSSPSPGTDRLFQELSLDILHRPPPPCDSALAHSFLPWGILLHMFSFWGDFVPFPVLTLPCRLDLSAGPVFLAPTCLGRDIQQGG